MKKIVISPDQAQRIEEDYLYHKGNDIDMENPEPHYSEARWQKWEGAGHETGSFGSGMYFTSEYPRDGRFDKQDQDDIFNAKYDPRNESEKFIRIGEHLYRVNTDFFKNLYKLKSEGEGKILEDLMESINSFVRTLNYPNEKSTKLRQRYWLRIVREAKMLGLSMPWDYRGFYEFGLQYCKDTSIKQTPATIFMEKNGFNGVDATNAGKYDSYWQGSVIYDLGKVEKDMAPVLGPRDEWRLKMSDYYNRNMTHDVLNNDATPTFYQKDDVTKDSPEELLKALKRYSGVLPANRYWGLPEEIKRPYLMIVYRNIKSGFISSDKDTVSFHFKAYGGVKELCNDVYLKDIVRFQLYKFINIPAVAGALLDALSWKTWWDIDKDTVLGFLNTYEGDVTKDYPQQYEDIVDEYQI